MQYSTISGQTWDMIAKEVYGKETSADKLMEANPKLLGIFVFPEGIVLEVPEIDEKEQNLPPWR